ncbi:hypothetical protein SeMB42_g00601 [Synchytrium endobioticum]|uniref:Uncharacterized protein n=1 Tax=Synchytrium endobioticum TaxID=286115 RepID=A0A507DSG0_9FUNG|nr:hypothetical protein SeLEV6574_g01266 [Synchytrium endobioticum]TPX53810.1 hypothetical protein SeMB42_g00601 [Synchytrium endobioticum]
MLCYAISIQRARKHQMTAAASNGYSNRTQAPTDEHTTPKSTTIPKNITPDGRHLLKTPFVLWFMHREPGRRVENYESAMIKVGAFATVEEFWGLYSRLKRPNDLPSISDILLFRRGTRPVWEDNPKGGKWIVRLKKGLASRYWEQLVLAVIGDSFDVGGEISGAVLSIRHSEDILSLWNLSANEGRVNLRIRDTMKKMLDLPPNCTMEYKAHLNSIGDGSSFKNTEMYR